ncbi:MAG TPA: hypothetical protein VGQ12_20355 [Candidatus Angelobacter sp.]|jgi:hypothetical protein|nr:hypothetical protein [Candidatus Angelobacter sp.]
MMKNVALVVSMACVVAVRPVRAQENTHSRPNGGAVQVQMHNVMYHFTDQVAVHLINVGGSLVPLSASGIPVFDDKTSFKLQITAAEMTMDPQSLANVLNSHVFAGNDAPLKDISITIEKGQLKVKGKLHNKGDIGFETEGRLSATGDGKIRLHAEKIKALHLPMKGLMDLFGLDIADLIKNGKVRGVQVKKDDLIFDPEEIFPPPKISGKITDIHLEGNTIVQVFGEPKKYPWIKVSAQNYMAYRGNKLQFGKLLMTDTDLVLIDPAPKDPFDFYLDRYKDQLVAGYSKTTPSFGLNVYMVDYNKLKQKRVPAKTAEGAK